MQNVRAIVIHEHGDPATVARLETVSLAPPQPHEARVRISFAPINPADINVLEGRYPVLPILPGIAGVEGAGVIETCTHPDFAPGTQVLLPPGFGSWREAGNVPISELIPIPAGIAPEQAAMLRINPPTALRMIRDFAALQPGDWLVQNAANSGVGRAVIQICAQAGIRTFNAVRRVELIKELKALGADEVVLDDATLPDMLRNVCGKQGVALGLNTVGGESALRLAGCLAEGGSLVTYGAMGKQPLRIPNGLLIFKNVAFRGFWVTRWYRQATPAQKQAMADEIFELSLKGRLHTPVDAIYSLDEITQALAHTQQNGRAGKILLRCSA